MVAIKKIVTRMLITMKIVMKLLIARRIRSGHRLYGMSIFLRALRGSGSDVFGQGTFVRPWHQGADELTLARRKADAAFELFTRLGVPFYTFHDTDVAPEGDNLAQYRFNLAAMVDVLAQKQEATGLRLLWGTANLFSHRRYAAGAATNPDPEVFAYAATQVFSALNATRQLGGANYVLWGGREGYDTLLNTDLARERKQFGRFLSMWWSTSTRSVSPATY